MAAALKQQQSDKSENAANATDSKDKEALIKVRQWLVGDKAACNS